MIEGAVWHNRGDLVPLGGVVHGGEIAEEAGMYPLKRYRRPPPREVGVGRIGEGAPRLGEDVQDSPHTLLPAGKEGDGRPWGVERGGGVDDLPQRGKGGGNSLGDKAEASAPGEAQVDEAGLSPVDEGGAVGDKKGGWEAVLHHRGPVGVVELKALVEPKVEVVEKEKILWGGGPVDPAEESGAGELVAGLETIEVGVDNPAPVVGSGIGAFDR
jgi:hypothetical protein